MPRCFLALCLLIFIFAVPAAGSVYDFPFDSLDQIIASNVLPLGVAVRSSDQIISANLLPSRQDAGGSEPALAGRKPESRAKAGSAGGLKGEKAQPAKERRAQMKSIAALLAHYNKKLSPEGAERYAGYILHAGEKFRQDPFVIAAMIVNESSARHDAVSRGGDYGLMQVRWRVHKNDITKKYPHIREASDMLDPKDNVMVGTEIFSRYRASAADLRGGLLRYSAGNRKLAQKIFSVMERLERDYRQHLSSM